MTDKELFNKFLNQLKQFKIQNKYADVDFGYYENFKTSFKNLDYSLEDYTKCVNYFESEGYIKILTSGYSTTYLLNPLD